MSNPVGGGTSGGVLMHAFERLGIADAIKDKLTFGAGGPAGLSATTWSARRSRSASSRCPS